MENYASKLDKAVEFKVADETTAIQNNLVVSIAEDILKERAELVKKAISKQRSLTGQYYKDNKPDVPGTWSKDSEGNDVQNPGTYSTKEAMHKAGKLKENLDKLDEAITACLVTEFVENTAEDAPTFENQQKAFVKADKARWDLLKRYTNKQDVDNYNQW